MKFKFNTSRHPIMLLALIGSLLMLVRIVEKLDQEYGKQPATADAKTADFIVEGAIYQEFNPQGKLANQFRARSVRYFGKTEKGTISEPVIDINAQTPQANSWHITANRGELDGRSKIINLYGDVEMHRLASPTTEPLTLKTSTLDIDIRRKVVHNDAPVSLLSPSGNIRGVGIDGSLDDGQYKIRKDVEMIILPQPKNSVETGND